MDSTHPAPKLGIIVVNYGSHALLEDHLERASAAARSATSDPVVVVVDNFTSTAETEALASLAVAQGWLTVLNARNEGFGRAMNAGVAAAKAAGCSVFLLLNPDAMIDAATIAALVSRCAAEPLTLRSPRILRPDGTRWFDGGTVSVAHGWTSTAEGSDSSAPGGWLSGACLAVHADLWDASGGFDDDYFLYWEDVDLSWRCVAAGGALIVDHDLAAFHSVGGTQLERGKSPLYVYFNCRNRLVFASKHLARADRVKWLAMSIRYGARVALRGGRREFLRHPALLSWAAIRGTISGGAQVIVKLPR